MLFTLITEFVGDPLNLYPRWAPHSPHPCPSPDLINNQQLWGSNLGFSDSEAILLLKVKKTRQY